MLPGEWELLRTEPAGGSWNMACDLALLARARDEGVGFLRVYGWSNPTVSLGRNERTEPVFFTEAFERSGLGVVRRPTGGRALLHHREVTYSFAIPIADVVRWQHAYAAINALLLAALKSLGIPALIVGAREEQQQIERVASDRPANSLPAGAVCFSGIARGELAAGGRKLVASSVWRERGAYLQHGSIPVFDDQPLLIGALGDRITPPDEAATLCRWLPGTPSVEEAANRVELALRGVVRECGNARPWSIPADMIPVIESTATRLERTDWLWRR